MGRPSNAGARRSEIIQAAIRLVGQHGFAGTTTAAIARAAGLAPGLIHYHFKDKQEILLAVVEALAATAQQRLQLRLHADQEGEPLNAWIEARLGLGADAELSAVAAWVMIGREAISDPQVRAPYQAALQRELDLLRDLLTGYARAQGRQATGVDRLAISALTFAEGCFSLASATRDLLPVGFAAGALRQLLHATVASWPPGPG